MKTTLTVFFTLVVALLTVHAEVMGGIGVVLVKPPGATEPLIKEVVVESFAAEAGIKPGTFVISIDGAATRNKPLLECVTQIRGAAGTKITLELADFNHTKTNKVTLTRGEIKFNSPGQNGTPQVTTNAQ